MTEKLNPFTIAQQQFDQAAEMLGLELAMREFLRWPQHELSVTFPVKMDDGTSKIFRGFHVQYNSSRGPTKGGIRWHPDETIDIVRALSAWMTWKTAVVDIPLGGGEGGIICNPKVLSLGEQERLARAYIRAVSDTLGVNKGILGPDVYTNPKIMAWMMDEYETIRQQFSPGIVTGKPLILGGSQGKRDAAARGAIFCVREACKMLSIDLSGGSAVVQGFGSVGQSLCLLCQELLGLKIIAVSDSGGAIYKENGFRVRELVNYKQEYGQVVDFPGSSAISHDELFELETTVLFPAALEHSVTANNAKNIKAKLLCELANGPTTPDADTILHEKNIFVIPDLLANAGGVTVSYLEQIQNACNHYWTLEEIHNKLDERMSQAFQEVENMQKKRNIPTRMAAYMVAVQRVADAVSLRGWI